MPLRDALLVLLSLLMFPAYSLPASALLAASDTERDQHAAPGGAGTGGGSGAGPILKKAAPNVGFSCLPDKCMCEGAAQCLDLGRTGLCHAAVTCTGESCTCERIPPEHPSSPRPASH